MSFKEMQRRLAQLEAEAERQAASMQQEVDQATTAAIPWDQVYQEMATACRADLLNRRAEVLLVWADLHCPELLEGMVTRVRQVYADYPGEWLWGPGNHEWYFDLCRLLGAPYQRKYWMSVTWPRPEHVYWPGDPLYEQKLGYDIPGRREP